MNNYRIRILFLSLFVITTLHLVAQVNAGFTITTPVPNCNPAIYTFTNTSTGVSPLTYEWNFGVYPGVNSIFKDPGTTYLRCGTFTVTLIVTDNTGKKDTAVQDVTIRCSPTASFTASPTSGCAPFTTNFNSNSVPGSGSINSYVWDFGDGYGGTTANPSHTYNVAGCKNVTLIVRNNHNCTNDTTINNIVCIDEVPHSDFTAATTSGCTLPFDASFQASPSSGQNPYTYQWLFQGGTPSTSTGTNPTVRYTSAGNYTVTLITTDAKGCSDTLVKTNYMSVANYTADFTTSDTIVCSTGYVRVFGSSSTTASWYWTISAGGSRADYTAQNTYFTFHYPGLFNICANVTFPGGCVVQKCKTVTAKPAPIAQFNVSGLLNTCIIPNTLNFTDASVGNNLQYAWNFPGGIPSTANTATPPPIRYNNCGNYSASLIVTDNLGCKSNYNRPALVNLTCPKASFTVSPINGCNPLTSTFNSSSSTGQPVSWLWNFGDPSSGSQNTSTLPNPSHTYILPGCYDVTLTTTNAEGCISTTTTISAVCTDHKPHANFSGNPAYNCVGKPVQFVDSSTNTYEYTEYFWDFHGEPYVTESSERNPPFVYSDTGYVDVTLIVSNRGCADTITKDNYIYLVGPVAIGTTTVSCGGMQVTLDATRSIGAQHYAWYIPGGNPSADSTPVVTTTFATPGVHQAWLTVTNDSTGCTNVNGFNFEIKTLQANFSGAPLTGCAPLQTCMNNFSTGAARYKWSILNSTGTEVITFTDTSKCFSLTKAGIYSVMLVAFDTSGCSDTMFRKDYITVSKPIAAFNTAPTMGCAPLEVEFTDVSVPTGSAIKSWHWAFGDVPSGTRDTSTLKNPTHIYTQAGWYSTALSIKDDLGCTGDSIRYKYILVTDPKAAFTTASINTCEGTNVCFTVSTNNYKPTYQWNFGDGTTSAIYNPCHTYTVSGIFAAQLLVTDSIGCTDSTTLMTTVNTDKPSSGFVADTVASTCPPLTVTFTNSSTGIDPQSNFLWLFGDGQVSSAKEPVHIYNDAGAFDVTLIVKNPNGCIDTLHYQKYILIGGPSAYVATAPTSGCAPHFTCFKAHSASATNFMWNFGDGAVLPGSDSICYTYEHSGIFYPELILSDAAGCVFSLPLGTVQVGGAVANFTNDNSFLCTSGMVNFTDSSYGVSPVKTWQWDFGDTGSGLQNTSNLQNPSHYYAGAGTFTVTLNITTTDGCANQSTRTVIAGGAPVVAFAINDSLICSPKEVSFTNRSIATVPIVTRIWNFGDPGSGVADTSSLINPSHYYTSPGNYTVTLIEIAGNGCSDTAMLPVVAHQKTRAMFTAANACQDMQPIAFNNQSQFASRYSWNFGNGVLSSLAAPVYTYLDSGTYTITLVAANNYCSDTTSNILSIYPVPEASFNLPANSLCETIITLRPYNTSTGATRYLWNYGNGDTSGLEKPVVTYDTAGHYTILLQVWNQQGCTDTATYSIDAHQKPVASFIAYDTCLNTQPLAFNNQTSFATYYNWNFGDNNISTIQSPSHRYTGAGTYIVQLIARTDFCSDTFTAPVNIYPVPEAAFSLPASVLCGPPAIVQTKNISTGATTYYWNFGNGDTSVVSNPSISYNIPGTYPVILKAGNAYYCYDTTSATVVVHQKVVAAFDKADTCLNTQPIVFNNQTLFADHYNWQLGDGNSSNLQNLSHTYAAEGLYTVKLLASNDFCTDSASAFVQIYPVPNASFTIPVSYICGPPASVYPNNTSTGASSYIWRFGNGDSSLLGSPPVSYYSPGQYAINLTAKNDFFCIDTATHPFVVHPYPAAVYIDISPSEGCAPLSVLVNANVTDGYIYTWNFGDGTPTVMSNSSAGEHIYTDTGTYTITLQVSSRHDCGSSFVLTDTVKVHVFPVADFDFEINTTVEPVNGLVVFTNKSQNADFYIWDFGDGSGATDEHTTHIYNQSDNFTVTLIAQTSFGCADSISKSLEVVKKTLFVPNAFAPDFNGGDGLVNIWKPVGTGLRNYRAQIFDTYGELLWESALLTEDGQPAEGWNGTYQGLPCHQDAYVWKVEAVFTDGSIWEGMAYKKGERKRTIGSVTLIR